MKPRVYVGISMERENSASAAACLRCCQIVGRVLAVAILGLVITGAQRAAAATLLVDDNHVECPTAPYTTISAAVAAASPGDTIQVCAGAYPENVTIPTASLTINGAQSGNPVSGRTFAGVGESTVTGMFTIQAAGVTIDGFSLTNPIQGTGILIKTIGDSAVIQNNFINGIGGTGFSGNTQAIYLERGPDNVKVLDNDISNVAGLASSNGGVFLGDSTSTNPSVNTLISGNSIHDIQSVNRGAYAIHVNNGNGSTSNSGLQIRNNTIDRLTGGGWVHAIGLEAKTPGVIVYGNSVTNLTGPSTNTVAVWFESEESTSFATGHVNQNNLDVTLVNYGIAVDPTLSAAYPNLSVDGTCNWWGASNGPGPVGPGSGSRVTPNVDFTPWLIAPAPGGACLGGQAAVPGKVTGGGQISGSDPLFSPTGDLLTVPAITLSAAIATDPTGKATFGFVAKCCDPSGNLDYQDQSAGVRIKAQSVDALQITSPGTSCPSTPGSQHATFGGTASVIRSAATTTEPYTVDVDDCGEPGTADTFGIKTSTYSNGPSTLIGGDIQIHKQ
jgi:hypothetical protein